MLVHVLDIFKKVFRAKWRYLDLVSKYPTISSTYQLNKCFTGFFQLFLPGIFLSSWLKMQSALNQCRAYSRRGSKIFFVFLKIRFWDELGPYGRWGAVQHVKIKFISIRVFLVSKKSLVFDPGRP